MTTALAKFALSWLFKLKGRSRYQILTVGSSSKVAFWRIKPVKENRLIVGQQSIVETRIVFERDQAGVSVGDRTFIGAGTMTVSHSITIGNDVMIAWGVVVADHNSHSVNFSERLHDVVDWIKGEKNWANVRYAPVRVCDKVWIGFSSIILKGTTIGEGAVVGAGSVVTKDVPPWTIVAGNPARVIREIPENER